MAKQSKEKVRFIVFIRCHRKVMRVLFYLTSNVVSIARHWHRASRRERGAWKEKKKRLSTILKGPSAIPQQPHFTAICLSYAHQSTSTPSNNNMNNLIFHGGSFYFHMLRERRRRISSPARINTDLPLTWGSLTDGEAQKVKKKMKINTERKQ